MGGDVQMHAVRTRVAMRVVYMHSMSREQIGMDWDVVTLGIYIEAALLFFINFPFTICIKGSIEPPLFVDMPTVTQHI